MTQTQKTGGSASGPPEARSGPSDGIETLKQQHRKVESLLGGKGGEREIRAVASAWLSHARREEEDVYPAARAAGDAALDLEVGAAETRADLVKLLLADLLGGGADDLRAAKWRVLGEELRALIEAEERDETGVFARIAATGVDLATLGDKLKDDDKRTTGPAATADQGAAQGNVMTPAPRVLRLQGVAKDERHQQETDTMARYTPDRDERGRFMSDDDDRGDGGRGQRSSDRRRDDEGRFMSDDRSQGYRGYRGDDDRRGSRSREDYDDDRRYSRDRGQGGWFGDSEGHSEASRRGWEDRRDDDRGYRSRSYDDDRGRSRDRDYDDDRRYRASGHDDDRRRSRDYEDDDRRYSRDRGQGGWFGDSEGHSEASRRGWEGRRDDDRGYRSSGYDDDRRRSRDYDDDRGSGRDRGQSGWFGDSEGHSQASRRGWANRR